MIELVQLLSALKSYSTVGSLASRPVAGICHDSRLVDEHQIFVALRGTKFDAQKLIPDVTKKGCAAVVTEEYQGVFSPSSPLIIVPDAREALCRLSYHLYGQPAENTLNIGVTGTNGKTSVAWLLTQAFSILKGPSVYSGTLGLETIRWDSGPKVIGTAKSDMTTADPPALFSFLQSAIKQGATSFISEVSSHAIHQKRAISVNWSQCIFTNLTRDHLDYHGTMEEYGRVKASLFLEALESSKKKDKTAIINIDDNFGRNIVSRLRGSSVKVVTFSSKGLGEINLISAEERTDGTEIECSAFGQDLNLHYKLIGDYNVSNILAVVAALAAFGESAQTIMHVVGKLEPVPGRLERIGNRDIGVFVDYAHTPDALDKAQRSIRAVTKGKLITVFGCGGDRDRGKRPEMGRVVAELADCVVITSDNPRSEVPEAIIEEILPGVANARQVIVEPERRAAIRKAIALASPGDVILVAGKGHEPYQEIKGVKHRFDDREVCREELDLIYSKGV